MNLPTQLWLVICWLEISSIFFGKGGIIYQAVVFFVDGNVVVHTFWDTLSPARYFSCGSFNFIADRHLHFSAFTIDGSDFSVIIKSSFFFISSPKGAKYFNAVGAIEMLFKTFQVLMSCLDLVKIASSAVELDCLIS